MLRGFSLVVDLIILVCLIIKEIAHCSLFLQCNCWSPTYKAVVTYLNPHVVLVDDHTSLSPTTMLFES